MSDDLRDTLVAIPAEELAGFIGNGAISLWNAETLPLFQKRKRLRFSPHGAE